MEDERIGFIGIVIEDISQASRVNQVISQYQGIVTGRIGVPDHARNMAVIGLLVRAGLTRITFPGSMSESIPGEAHDGAYPLRRYLRMVDVEVP